MSKINDWIIEREDNGCNCSNCTKYTKGDCRGLKRPIYEGGPLFCLGYIDDRRKED